MTSKNLDKSKYKVGDIVWISFGQEPVRYTVTRLPSQYDKRYQCGDHCLFFEHHLFATKKECILNEIEVSRNKIADEKINLDFFENLLNNT